MKQYIVIGVSSLLLVVFVLLGGSHDAGAYDSYRPGGSAVGCSDCHPGFINRGVLHDMHVGNQDMTNTCTLCHTSTGDVPKTWTSGAVGGQSCRGCHGVDNATQFNWATGLRAHHAAAGAPADANGMTCATCHGDDPAPSPESTLPVYYSRSDVNVQLPCSATEPGGEDFDGDMRGLDNDGDLAYDQDDSDCSATDSPNQVLPDAVQILAVSPNPVIGDGTEVLFQVPATSDVSVNVYDMTGRRVASRAYGTLPSGPHVYFLGVQDASGRVLPSGVYVVRVESGGSSTSKRVIVLK